jgi:signal transduction histidine kinase
VARLLAGTPEQILDDPEVFFRHRSADRCADLSGATPRARPLPISNGWAAAVATAATPRWLQIRATTGVTANGERAIHGAMLDVTALKQAQQDLERSREELRRLASHREERVEQERARLAREFHDELGQVLTTARMHLQLLVRQLPAEAPGLRAAAQDIEAMIGEAGRSVKAIASDLRPAALNLGLAAAVEWLAGRVLAPAGIAIRCRSRSGGPSRRQPCHRPVSHRPGIAEQHRAPCRGAPGAYHAGTPRRRVAPAGRRRRQGLRCAGVDHTAHFGLLGIAERVTALGGSLEIDSSPGDGTRLSVSLPDSRHGRRRHPTGPRP